MENSNKVKIFITGATGYIGGSVLTHLLKTPEKYDITALIRSKEQVSKFDSLGVKTVLGDLDSLDLIKKIF